MVFLEELMILISLTIWTNTQTVEKYELNGVSLRRINKTHNLSDVTVSNPIGIDIIYVKVDMSSNGVDRSSDLRINSKPNLLEEICKSIL